MARYPHHGLFIQASSFSIQRPPLGTGSRYATVPSGVKKKKKRNKKNKKDKKTEAAVSKATENMEM